MDATDTLHTRERQIFGELAGVICPVDKDSASIRCTTDSKLSARMTEGGAN